MRAFSSYVLITLLSCCIAAPVSAGPLREVEDRAEGRDDRSASHDREARSENTPPSSASSRHDHGGGRILLHVLLSPWTLPHALLDDPCYELFAPYPYADAPAQLRPASGRADCIAPDGAAPATPQARGKRVAGQLDLEGSYVFDHVLAGSVAARLQLPRRVSLEARLSYFEDLAASPREQALGGTAHVAYRFAQTRHVAFRSGAGVRVFALSRPELGLDLFYAVDVFGKRPIMAHLELHGGALNQAFAGQARLTVGVQIWKLELYAGYDHQAFSSRGHVARLGGPVLGVRAWF